MKSSYFRFRLSDQERELLAKLASTKQMSGSEYIRYLIRKAESQESK